jgi:hypothetical protein
VSSGQLVWPVLFSVAKKNAMAWLSPGRGDKEENRQMRSSWSLMIRQRGQRGKGEKNPMTTLGARGDHGQRCASRVADNLLLLMANAYATARSSLQ